MARCGWPAARWQARRWPASSTRSTVSTAVMYSTEADMVPFSGNDRIRAQLAAQEINYQLNVIRSEV